jgi:Tfp pilus assembly protein PilV
MVPMRLIAMDNSMKRPLGVSGVLPGFSLAEVLAALTIGAMVLVAVVSIYGRAERSAAAVTHRLDSSRLPSEIMQRIAEDLDRVISSSSDAKVTFQNKFENLFPTARLTITRTILDSRSREQTFEQIIWQTGYDFESVAGGLVLYRSHSGITLEDKTLNKNKEDWERELFVPLCGGVTFFRINAVKNGEPLERWSGALPPPGIMVTISFAEPYKSARGTLDVLDEDKITRVIAIDRTKKIKFEIEARTYPEGEEGTPDVNSPESEGLPSDSPKRAEKAK